MRFNNKLKSAMLVAASLFCFNAAFADTALIAWGNCSTSSIEGTTVNNQLVGNEGDTAEGFVLSLTGNTAKTYSSANKLTVPLPDGTTGERTTIKLSNGAENTLTLPEGKLATKITFYSYVNYNLADKGNWGRTSYWGSVGGQDYTIETAVDTMKYWLATKTTYTVDEPDAISFNLDRVSEIKFKNTGEQACVIIAVEYEDENAGNTEEPEEPAAPTYEWTTAYSWESSGVPVEFGGVASYVNGNTKADRVNYQNSGYYTLCLNGKKDNINDATPSDNAGHIEIALDEAIQEGDSIFITGYRNKNVEGKAASIYFLYETGTEVNDDAVYANICNDDGVDYDNDGNDPTTHGYEVPAAAAGSKVIKLSRNAAGTNLFITKFVIKRLTAQENSTVKPSIKTLSTTYLVGEGTANDTLVVRAYVKLPSSVKTAYIGGAGTNNAVTSGYKVATIGWEGLEEVSPALYLGDPQNKAIYQKADTGINEITIVVPKFYDNDGVDLMRRVESILTYRLAVYEDEALTSQLTQAISGRAQLEAAEVTFEVSTDTITLDVNQTAQLEYSFSPDFLTWQDAATYVFGSFPNVSNLFVSNIRVDEETLQVRAVYPGNAAFSIEFDDTVFTIPVVVNPVTLDFNTDTIYVQEGDTAQVQFTYAPASFTWQEAAQYIYGAEPVISADPFGIIRYDEETLAIKGYYPGECNLIIELGDTAVFIPVVVTAKPEEVEEETEYAVISTLDFENEETYTKGWTIGSKTTAFYGTRAVGDSTSHFMNLKNTGSGNDANTYTIANKMFLEAEKWTMDFDFAGYNSNSKTVYLEVQQAEGTLLKFQFAASWSAPVTVTDGAGNVLGTINCDLQDKNTRGNDIAVTTWHHLSLIDEGEGVYATVTAADGTEEIAKVKIAESGVHPTGLNLQQGNALSQWAIDDIILSFFGAGELVDVPAITAKGETYEANTITITGNENTTIYYTLTENGVTSDAILYEDPFTVSTTVTIKAWAVSANGNDSESESLDVVAGEISTPTATITKVTGLDREITLAATTPDAVITYFLNGATEGVVYDAPFTISESTDLTAIATRGEFTSDTLTTTLAAGTEVQLAEVTFAVAEVADSTKAAEYEANNLKDIVLTADQSSVLCTPEVEIEYTYIPLDQTTNTLDESKAVTATVAAGTTLEGLGLGKLTAIAKNADYATSEENILWLKRPSNLIAERVYDFSRAAWGGHTSDLTVTISSTVETINGTDYGTVAFGDSIPEGFLVQTGTTWLKRGGYDGFYQMNGGSRCIALQNLEAGNIVKVYGRYGNAAFDLSLVDNGVAEADVAETTAGSVYTYNIIARGTIAWSMARFGYVDSIIVYSDPNQPKVPTITLESAKGGKRYVSFATSTQGGDIYYSLGSYSVEEKTDTITVEYLKNDTIGGVEPIYGTSTSYRTYNDTTYTWSDYELYDTRYTVELDETTPYVRAYTFFMGQKSDIAERTIEVGTVLTLNTPTIKYVGSTEAGKQFIITVDNSDKLEGNPQNIYYTLPGGELTAYTDTIVVPNDVYGWMTAISKLDGCNADTPAYRYLDARDSYNETYQAVLAESDSLPGEAADLEIADIATLNASLNAAFKPSGRIYFHKTVHAGYNALVLPFAMTTANLENGTVKVTDETGKALTRGTDFEVVRIQASTSFTTLADDLAAGTNVHTGNLVANTQSYLLKVADALVGHELIFVSGENAQNLSINKVDLTTVPEEGKWLVKNNATFAPVVAEVPVYLVNEDGTALVRQEAGAVVAPYSYAVIAADSFTDEIIPLIGTATSINTINMELQEEGLIFDMMGRRVTNPQAGKVYLRNGKKFMQR